MYTYRATVSSCHNYLYSAKKEGIISDFEKKRVKGKVMWLVKGLPPTRYDAYHHPGERYGELLLTGREVLVFTEAWWAARGVNPVNRAGQNFESESTRNRRYAKEAAEREEMEDRLAKEAWDSDEDDDAVDITNQRELPATIDSTAEEDE